MHCYSRQGSTIFKREKAYGAGPSIGLCSETTVQGPSSIPPGLFGHPTETEVVLSDLNVKSLLDTGSTVSTLSRTYYRNNLAAIPLQKLTTLLDIECADGQQLPYEGYIEAGLQSPQRKEIHPCILLIVPDSNYSSHIPMLIGTTILHHIMGTLQQQHGEKYLHRSDLTSPWYLIF